MSVETFASPSGPLPAGPVGGVLGWLDGHQFVAGVVGGLVVILISALFKQTRRLWAMLFQKLRPPIDWLLSFRVVHKSRVRPRRAPLLAPVRWMGAFGPQGGEATLVNTASGLARDVQVDDGYNVKVLGDAQWSEFPQRGAFKCVLDYSYDFHSVFVSWVDELNEPHLREEVRLHHG